MDSITKNIELNLSAEEAFGKFVNNFHEWWPKEYTWSLDTLEDISIASAVGGFCTEIGPNGFRVDWGTVIDFQENKLLSFKWQIGPAREPVPDPGKASLVTIAFHSISDWETDVELTHSDFKNHGDNYLEYLNAMDSKHGWSYLLNCYKEYAIT